MHGGWPKKNEPFAFRHGTATFVAFILAGAIPLGAYMFPGTIADPFPFTVVLTLFLVGAFRSLVTRAGWLKSGMEMLLLGVVASART